MFLTLMKKVPRFIKRKIHETYSWGYDFLHFKKSSEHKRIVEEYKERYVSYGDNYPDKTFYIIYLRYCTNAVSFIKYLISYCLYAEKKGWIPIVDQKTYDFTFLGMKTPEKKSDNVWEYFFEQPAGYTLEDIKDAKNVILCNPLALPSGCALPNELRDLSNESIKVFNKFIRLKKGTMDRIKNIAAAFEYDINKKYIGVNIRVEMLRGALKKSSLYYNHLYSTKDQILEVLEDIKRNYDHNAYKVFLCCDDLLVGDKLSTMLKPFVSAGLKRNYCNRFCFADGDLDKPLDDEAFFKQWNSTGLVDAIEIFYEYFASIYLFSKCDVVYCGDSDSVAFMAMLLKGKTFEQIHFIKQQRFHGVKENSKLYFHKDKNGYIVLH